jgi:hypothetical protein
MVSRHRELYLRSRKCYNAIMRNVPLTLAILLCSLTASAGEIREFDIKTIERLGNELTQVDQTREKGATTLVRKRAQQTAKAALKGKLFRLRYEAQPGKFFDVHYDYVVLDNPDGSGFLVYALGQGGRPSDTVVHGHFRVTVSADGRKAERVDALAHSIFVDTKESPVVENYKKVAFSMGQPLGTRPVETLVYASNHMKMPIAVATPNGVVWWIEKGKITKAKSKK